jgi:putative acetyltransferase
VLIEPREPADRTVRQLLSELQAELTGSDNSRHSGHGPRDGVEFMVGLIDGRPVACGSLVRVGPTTGEIQRMYVRPAWRGQGLSRLILAALEERAIELGYHTLRLAPGGDLGRAVQLYRGAGFHTTPVEAGDDDPNGFRFEKSLLPALA